MDRTIRESLYDILADCVYDVTSGVRTTPAAIDEALRSIEKMFGPDGDHVLIERGRWERVLLIASHANHHRVEECCDPSWWPESVTLKDGDLDPVGEDTP